MLVFCGSALADGDDVVVALVGGGVEGVLAAVVVYALLRFDYGAVPAFLAAGTILAAIETAAPKGTAEAWAGAAVAGVVAILSAWAVMRFLERRRTDASPGADRLPGADEP